MGNIKNNNYGTTPSTASIVAQFTVYTNPRNLLYLLKTLEKEYINISAFTIQEFDNESVFKFIVGKSKSQSANDIDITRSILKQYRFNFDESKVVRVNSSKNKAMLTSYYSELIKSLAVYNSYLGEEGSIIFETCCPTKTLNALSQLY